MSGASSDQILSEAFDLIEAAKHEEAQAILEPILEEEPDNVDAWWLYAHAVTDSETGRMALNQVLRLDSTYQEAQDLLAKLDETETGRHTPDSLQIPPSLPEDSDMVGIESLEQDEMTGFSLEDTGPIFDDRTDESQTQKTRLGPRIALAILVILVILVVGVILLLNPFAAPGEQTVDTQPPGATSVSQQALPTPLSSLPMLETVGDQLTTAVTDSLAGFDLVAGGIGVRETSLGKTLLASVCATRETLRDTLASSMNAVAATGMSDSSDIQAIGIAMIDCNMDRLLRIIATSTENAASFSAGKIDSKEFEAHWIAAA